MARFQIINETCDGAEEDEWSLCFQYGRYYEDGGKMYEGYRFIWRRPNDRSLQAARGQARIPSIEYAKTLMDQAISEGWGNHNCE